MSYLTYEMQQEGIMERMKEKREKDEKKWAKERKSLILAEIKQLKGNAGDLSKVYTKKEIAAIKRAEINEIKDELNAERQEELKTAKETFENNTKVLKKQMAQYKTEYNKTKKRLSKINKDDLDFMMDNLNKKWEKQWGNTTSTRKTK